MRILPAIDRTVDILTDENDGACVQDDCSLREAIAAAEDGDTILFDLDGSPPWTITLLTSSSSAAPLSRSDMDGNILNNSLSVAFNMI